MIMEHASKSVRAVPARHGANVRTALILFSIAIIFFGGVIGVRYAGGSGAGIGALGLAIIGLLLVAMLRDVRR
jgi:hypothetical protein